MRGPSLLYHIIHYLIWVLYFFYFIAAGTSLTPAQFVRDYFSLSKPGYFHRLGSSGLIVPYVHVCNYVWILRDLFLSYFVIDYDFNFLLLNLNCVHYAIVL